MKERSQNLEPSGEESVNSTQGLIQQLRALQSEMRQMEQRYADQTRHVAEGHAASARNLMHYVSLRQQDLRSLQAELSCRGLSSLGRCEAHVMATLSRVTEVLEQLEGLEKAEPSAPIEPDFAQSRRLLARSTQELFGEIPSNAAAHIMVTLPSEAATDKSFFSELLAQGVDCVRINCAHDGPDEWMAMIEHLRSACEKQSRSCRIAMDLGGPKLRTGDIAAGNTVLKWSPRRDALGRTLAPASLWLHAEGVGTEPPVPADAEVPVVAEWLNKLQEGDQIRFSDARGRSRKIRVVRAVKDGVWAEALETAYVTPETELTLHTPHHHGHSKTGKIGLLPLTGQYLVLHRGDRLMLGDDQLKGAPARYDEHGQWISPAMIGCTLPSIFADLKVGERVLFDDGKIASRVLAVHERHVDLEVIAAGENGSKLRADKGINLPDSDLNMACLTDKDLTDLAFVVKHADFVNYSFVRRPDDVYALQKQLKQYGRPELPIVLKIENRQAFQHLPTLLLAAMKSHACGVMIARGDLAVEMGWQRLAEIQEEILWMCEAAHMPVIWATQVLENLSKKGVPTRAEITDAAMSVRAECVMLNKGPYILETVRVLVDILQRMQGHQVKKHPLLRRLHVADDLTLPAKVGTI